jgi:ABC-2 type transport system ATP-binding protein
MWDMVRDIVADGTSVLLTTQYLEEADQLADRVALLDHGGIVADGTPDQLKRRIGAEGGGGHLRLQFPDQAALDAAAALYPSGSKDAAALALEVPAEGGVRAVRDALDRLGRAGIEVEDLAIHTPDLDDVFLALTGRPPTEAAEIAPERTAS